jgi:Leucine-rich repeat (LRR) protein
MYENLLTGTIPEELYNLTKVTSFSVDTNRLSGTISTSIGQLSNLEFFRVSTNDFTGTIPSEVGNLSNASKYGTVLCLTCTALLK